MTVTAAPVLSAYPAGRETWKVWCDWCERWHIHSAGPGHRAAHCVCRKSPYSDGGYTLVAVEEPAPARRQRTGGNWCSPGGNCGDCPAERQGR